MAQIWHSMFPQVSRLRQKLIIFLTFNQLLSFVFTLKSKRIFHDIFSPQLTYFRDSTYFLTHHFIFMAHENVCPVCEASYIFIVFYFSILYIIYMIGAGVVSQCQFSILTITHLIIWAFMIMEVILLYFQILIKSTELALNHSNTILLMGSSIYIYIYYTVD